MQLRRITLDVLTPLEPGILTYAERINKVEKIDGVTITLLEVDAKTMTVEITIEGKNIPFQTVEDIIEELGGSIHSIDEVSTGHKVVEPRRKVKG
jgi:hypothetical protein